MLLLRQGWHLNIQQLHPCLVCAFRFAPILLQLFLEVDLLVMLERRRQSEMKTRRLDDAVELAELQNDGRFAR